MKKATWFVFFSFLAISCLNEPDCYLLNNNEIDAYFKVLGFSSDVVQTKSILAASAVEWPKYNNGFGDTLSQVTLPLNPKSNEVSFVFNYLNNNVHNLSIGYDHKVQFVSEDCGSRDIFTSLKVLNHNFDTVQLVNSTPTQPTSLNLNIFRCPITNQMGVKFNVTTHVEGIMVDGIPLTLLNQEITDPIVLPVSPDGEKKKTTYDFDFGGGVKKILVVKYIATSRRLGNACGIRTFFTELAADTTTLTAATIVNEKLLDLPVVNLEITK